MHHDEKESEYTSCRVSMRPFKTRLNVESYKNNSLHSTSLRAEYFILIVLLAASGSLSLASLRT
jgi:hypothetical protein